MLNHENQLQNLILECERLKAENRTLKELLAVNNIALPNTMTNPPFDNSSKTREEKIHDRIKLFKSLFQGRSDVYALRWESKNGKSGYAPACQNEWYPTLCKKPNIKCSECQNRVLLPLTDQVIFEHLSGKQTIGLYPLLIDDTCRFLAVDFDKKNWQNDVLAFVNTCKHLGVPAYVERSRSGNGGHVWIFFNQAIPASLSRKLGQVLISKTLKTKGQIELDSFDRLFPNQDTVNKGGFGNLIALPLQGFSRKINNSVFVDENFEPFPNQWGFLAGIKRITQQEVELIVNKLPSLSLIKELEMPMIQDLTIQENTKPITQLKVIQKNGLLIEKDGLPPSLLQQISQLGTFKNPNYFKAKAKRFSTYNIPSEINCTDDEQGFLVLPRGCLEELENLMKLHSIQLEIEDQSFKGNIFTVNFCGELMPQQSEAVESLFSYPIGILSASTGFGKTVIAAALIAKRKTNTLILVHRKPLMTNGKKAYLSF